MPSLESYPLPFLFCRTFGHSWEEFIPVGKRKPITGFRFSLHCTSCTMERHDSIDQLGQVGTREYVRPNGYYLGGKIKRSEARIVFNKRRRREALSRRERIK